MFSKDTHVCVWLCRNMPAPRTSRVGSLICDCDLISANWLIGAFDTEDTTMHADVRACTKDRRKRTRLGKKKARWLLIRALLPLPCGCSQELFVFVLDLDSFPSVFLFYPFFFSFFSLCFFVTSSNSLTPFFKFSVSLYLFLKIYF